MRARGRKDATHHLRPRHARLRRILARTPDPPEALSPILTGPRPTDPVPARSVEFRDIADGCRSVARKG